LRREKSLRHFAGDPFSAADGKGETARQKKNGSSDPQPSEILGESYLPDACADGLSCVNPEREACQQDFSSSGHPYEFGQTPSTRFLMFPRFYSGKNSAAGFRPSFQGPSPLRSIRIPHHSSAKISFCKFSALLFVSSKSPAISS
jgi:hypothetical protein